MGVEEDTFWREIKEEKIIGDIHCPICKTLLIRIPAVDLSIAYCPTCKKYFELIKKNVNDVEQNIMLMKYTFVAVWLPMKFNERNKAFRGCRTEKIRIERGSSL